MTARVYECAHDKKSAVDREEAAQALAVLRKVVSQTQDATALQNYGLIWIIQGVANMAAFMATHYLFSIGYEEPPAFLALWGPVIVFDSIVVAAFKKERAGARTFVDTQLWTIWTTFLAAVMLVAVLNHVMGLKAFFLGPVIGVLAATAFASMGSLMGRRWYAGAAFFALVAVSMATWHEVQFIILGVTWGLAQIAGGVALDRGRRRRLALRGTSASEEARVV